MSAVLAAPGRGPDGRYGYQSGAKVRGPVSVTCYGCRRVILSDEPIWVDRERYVFCGEGWATKPLPVGPWCGECEGVVQERPWRNAVAPRNCRNCGRVFHAVASRYCSDRCENSWRAAERRLARQRARDMQVCAGCGDGFTALRLDARYCSPACRQKAYRLRAAEQAAERGRGAALLAEYNARLGGAA